MLKELRESLVQRKHAQALALAERAVQEISNSADAQHLSAIAFARHGLVQKAAECFERALLIQPENVELHMNMARLHLGKGDIEQAKQAFKNASVLDPNLAAAHSEMGHLEASRGRLEDAEEFYLTALKADPHSIPGLVGLGHLRLEQKDVAAALKVSDRALKIAASDARVQALAGRAFFANRNYAFAHQALQNCLKIRPEFHAARVLMAQVMLAESNLPGAEAELDIAALRMPDDLMMRLAQAELFARTNRMEKAATNLDFVLTAIPQHLPALRARASIDVQMGNSDAALARLRQSAERFPSNTAINAEWVQTLLQNQMSDAALTAADGWRKRAPESAAAHTFHAGIAESLRRFDEAQQSAEKALQLNPQELEAALVLARSRFRQGRLNEALSVISSVRTLAMPDTLRMHMLRLRGRILDALGERSDALKQWQDAAQLEVLERQHVALPALQPGPERGTLDNGSPAIVGVQITFLLGVPAGGVEAMSLYLAHAPNTVVLNDRFSAESRVDLISQASDQRLNLPFSSNDLEHVRSRYLKALRRMLPQQNALGQPVQHIFDWVPAIDARQFRIMQAAIPEARWLVVQRDANDCLLGAMAGMVLGVSVKQPEVAAALLANHTQHLGAIAAELRKPDYLLAFDPSVKPAELDKLRAHFGLQTIDPEIWPNAIRLHGDMPAYFSNQRWQAYEKPLAGLLIKAS
jgi:tetratricopeptide (TPR) repeat protein